MAKVVGVIEQVSQKDVNTKFGLKQTWSMKIAGAWHNCSFVSGKNPKCNTGDEVEFDAESGSYGSEAKNIRVLKTGVSIPTSASPTAAPGTAPAARPYSGGGGGYKEKVFPIPALHGDRSIVRQNALARATELMIHASGGKPYEVNDKVLDYIIKTGDLDMAEVKAEMEAEAATPAEVAPS